jgi:hypothetical protein
MNADWKIRSGFLDQRNLRKSAAIEAFEIKV